MAEIERTDDGPRARVVRPLLAGVVVVLAVAAVPLLLSATDDAERGEHTNKPRVDDALSVVRAAVGQTNAAGSFEFRFEVSSVHPAQCAPTAPSTPGATGVSGASCSGQGATTAFDATGTGSKSFDPYVSTSTSQSQFGSRTIFVTDTRIWLGGGGAIPSSNPGVPLSQFAASVESALGPSQGALSVISLASPGGEVNLQEAAVADATPSGDGIVDGHHVTYYDVTIDMAQLADAPGLSEEQQRTIAAALPLLARGGYSGTTERIGIDDAGYVREVTAENHFTDGSAGVRHMVFFNFGCAPKLHAPGSAAPADSTTGPCDPAPVTTAPTTSTTSAATSSSTTTSPSTSTTSASTTTSTTSTVATTTTTTSGATTTVPSVTIPPTTTKP